MRVGIGSDVHALAKGRKLMLGGLEIPFERGLAGHSDADVLLHAICDALLGAGALGDIGLRFPDNDARFRDISSVTLLEEVAKLLREANLRVVNLDATVVAQRPRLRPYVESMRDVISKALGVSSSLISVKATTTEGLGFAGREEGIAAFAICALAEGGEATA